MSAGAEPKRNKVQDKVKDKVSDKSKAKKDSERDKSEEVEKPKEISKKTIDYQKFAEDLIESTLTNKTASRTTS